MKNIKPVYFMHEKGLDEIAKNAIVDGALELIGLSQTNLDFQNFGAWKNNEHTARDASLNSYQSVDWYIEQGKKYSKRPNQLNASVILTSLVFEPWRKVELGGIDHYDILAVKQDLYSPETNFVIGLAYPGIATTVSTFRFNSLKEQDKYECIKTEIMHELGHVFGLIPKNRTQNTEKSLGKHCTNKCVMRQGLIVPDDWLKITDDRLRKGPLCRKCLNDLKDYFN